MEVRKIDAKTIQEAIAKKREEIRITEVTQTIQFLEKTVEKMLENLCPSGKIEGIHSWENYRFNEPEVREWIEARGFKIHHELVDGFYLIIAK